MLLLLVSTLAGVSLAGGISKVTPSSANKEVLVSLGGSGILSSAMVGILCEDLNCVCVIVLVIDCGAFSEKNASIDNAHIWILTMP